jgi:hypothetical protein
MAAYSSNSTEYYILSDALREKFEDIEWNLVHNYDSKEDTFEDVEFLLDDLKTCANLMYDLLGDDIFLKRYEKTYEATKFEYGVITESQTNRIHRTPLDIWIDRHAEDPRLAGKHCLVACEAPYMDEPYDIPGVLFDGTFEELVTGEGDNYIAEDYSDWVVVDIEVRSTFVTIFVDFSK